MWAAMDTSISEREFDYVYRCRGDVSMFSEEELTNMATEYGVTIKEYFKADANVLAIDGNRHVEEGRKFYSVYEKLMQEARVISESDFERITGQDIQVDKGSYIGISTKDEDDLWINKKGTILTNMTTGMELPVKWGGFACCEELTGNNPFYILNDEDFEMICAENESGWQEKLFMVKVENDSYAFGRKFYDEFVDRFPQDCAIHSSYDRVEKYSTEKRGEKFWMDIEEFASLSMADSHNADFKREWLYVPKIKVVDNIDFLTNYAVFLMMFIFITLVCIVAGLIIAYTRSITIALNNRYVFEDLKRLGASNAYLKREIRRQVSKVFTIPSILGTSTMYLLFIFILVMNDGYAKITPTEFKGLVACFIVIMGIGAIIYAVYESSLRQMRKILL